MAFGHLEQIEEELRYYYINLIKKYYLTIL